MADDARRKRLPLRWLTLAEFVGVVAVVIAALGYWDNHRERAQAQRDKVSEARERAAEARAGALKQTFLMTGSPEAAGERLRLASTHPDQVIQTQAISFPSEVRGDGVQTTGNPRIEAGWFEGGLDKALKAHGDKRRSGRLPVGVVTTFIEDGQSKTDQAVYLLGYSLHPRMLRSDKAEMEGLSLSRHVAGPGLQAALDAAWAQREPPAKP